MKAREEILSRIRTALADRPEPLPIERTYREAGSQPADVEQFAQRIADYRATVHRATVDGAAAQLTSILTGRSLTRIVIPEGFPTDWLPTVPIVTDAVGTVELDEVGAVLTTCAVAIAETGTIVLDTGPGQGPRAFTLVPDYHLCVVRADQIRAIVPDAIDALDPRAPLTWISGPSATSDIELRRVEGVHGPRTLDVLILD